MAARPPTSAELPIADPRSLVTSYVRNGFGEVIQQGSPDSGVTVYTRDARGLVTKTTDGRGVVTTMTYDAASRIKTRAIAAATTENKSYTYDAITGGNFGKGRLTSLVHDGGSIAMTYDVRGNVIKEIRKIGTVSYTVSYTYDLADRMTQITYPSGRQVQYVRDAQGRITAVNSRKTSTAAYTSIATGIAYQPLSRLITGLTHGNGLTLAQTHTADYELARQRLLDGATPVIDRTLARGDKLNITGITDAVTPANSMSFGYTAANRLNASTGPYGTLGWQYDSVGNRTQETVGAAVSAYAYPATSNRISSISTGGSAVRQMTYDGGGNMLTDVRLGSTFAYTPAFAGAGSQQRQ